MPTFNKRAPRTPLTVALILALSVAAGAQDRPESILPPGFGEPAPTPAPRPTAAVPRPSAPSSVAPGSATPPSPLPSGTPSATPSATPTPDPALAAMYEMPPLARRSLDLLGPASPREGALSPEAFGAADGRFVSTLMRRTAAPLPSRWMSILLRRLLAARLVTPARVDGADFAAERAWLLLRMGEAGAARAVVQSVDTLDLTPKLAQVGMNAMLAAGDPAGLCPLANAGAGGEPGWVLARAMCSALAGDPGEAGRRMATARRRRTATGIDLFLAQKVAGAGAQGRQSVTIEWDGVDRLTAWRWGLATATGVAVPAELYATTGPQVRYWQAVAPGVAVPDRLAAAELAAGQGVLSSAALVDLFAAAAERDDVAAADAAVAQDLRTAYTDRDAEARLRALRSLWGDAARVPYGRLVLTARAAATVPPTGEGRDIDRVVASLLTAGLDRAATRWRGVAETGGDAWAMIALADPDLGAVLGGGDVTGYAGATEHKRRLFFAGLAGLGRLSADDVEETARTLTVRVGAATSWTRALDRASAAGEQGTVVLLAAIGMQCGDWRGVPPEALFHIVRALRAVGLGGEARMIAAEAIARA